MVEMVKLLCKDCDNIDERPSKFKGKADPCPNCGSKKLELV